MSTGVVSRCLQISDILRLQSCVFITLLLFKIVNFIFFPINSLQAFVKDASSFSHEAVDRLLDVLTEGAHSKYLKQMAEVRLKRQSIASYSRTCDYKGDFVYSRSLLARSPFLLF